MHGYPGGKGMGHVRDAPVHPRPRGKAERRQVIAGFIGHCTNRRLHGGTGKLPPAGVCFARGETIPAERRRINLQSTRNRRLNHRRQAA